MKGILIFNLFYPYPMSIEDNRFLYLTTREKLFCVLHRNNFKALDVVDFKNELIHILNKDEDLDLCSVKYPIKGVSERHFTYEYTSDKYKSVSTLDDRGYYYRILNEKYFSDMAVIYEVDNIDDPCPEDLEFFTHALGCFLENYIWISNEFNMNRLFENNYPRMVSKIGRVKYDDHDKKLPLEERLVRNRVDIELSTYTDILNPSHSPLPREDGIKRQVGELFARQVNPKNSDLSLERKILIKAKEEIEKSNNYKYAYIEAFVLAEVRASRFIYEEMQKKGISKSKLSKRRNDLSMSFILNIGINLVVDDISEKEKQLLVDVDRLRQKRNNIIHRNQEVSKEEAVGCINIINRFIGFLSGKRY